MTCRRCRTGTVLGFLLLPDVWTNAAGVDLAVRHEIPLCVGCLPWEDEPVQQRPVTEVLEAEVGAWRRGEL